MDVRIPVLTNTLLKTLDEPLLGKYDRIVSGVPELFDNKFKYLYLP